MGVNFFFCVKKLKKMQETGEKNPPERYFLLIAATIPMTTASAPSTVKGEIGE
jgi:hypothetical protein